MQLTPGFLSRGHGGNFPAAASSVDAAPRQRPPCRRRAAAARRRMRRVAVTPDRAAGARLLIGSGCDFLIMDDGFQSARIHMD